MSLECAAIRGDLGAFLDGELRGSDMLRVSNHLAQCEACSDEAESFSGLGELVRSTTAVTPEGADMAGLASGVISRMRAEEAQSWSGLAERAVSDWHWAIVGVGSVFATVASTAALTLILAFGPGPGRVDSLRALLSNLGSPAGSLFLYGGQSDDGRDASLFQIENGEPMASGVVAALARRPLDRVPSEAELVENLADMVTRNGRVVSFDLLSPDDRQKTEELFVEIRRMRRMGPPSVVTAFTVHEVRLVTSTSVSAKGL